MPPASIIYEFGTGIQLSAIASQEEDSIVDECCRIQSLLRYAPRIGTSALYLKVTLVDLTPEEIAAINEASVLHDLEPPPQTEQ
jgi:hypothetical protein